MTVSMACRYSRPQIPRLSFGTGRCMVNGVVVIVMLLLLLLVVVLETSTRNTHTLRSNCIRCIGLGVYGDF